MKIRKHCGGLFESLETTVTIEPTREAIAAWAEQVYEMKCPARDIEVKSIGYDVRIRWDTHLVSLHGWGVLGMCDSAVDCHG